MHFYDHYLCLNRVCVLSGAGTVLNTGIFLNSADGWGQSDVLKQWEWTKTIKPFAVKLKLRCRRAPQSRNWTAESGNHFYIWSSVNIKLLIIAALRLGYKMCLPHIHHSVTQVKTVCLQQALCWVLTAGNWFFWCCLSGCDKMVSCQNEVRFSPSLFSPL